MEDNSLFDLSMSLSEKINKIRQLKKGKWITILLSSGSNIKGKICEINGKIYLKTFVCKSEKIKDKNPNKVKVISNCFAVEFKEVKQILLDSEKYEKDYKCFYKLILKKNQISNQN